MSINVTRRGVLSATMGVSSGVVMASLMHTRPARAADLAKPQGKVILTLSGLIKETNGEGVAEFDIAMLEALGLKSFTTTTPWYTGAVTFEGVRMAALLDRVGATYSGGVFPQIRGAARPQAGRCVYAGEGQGAVVHRLSL